MCNKNATKYSSVLMFYLLMLSVIVSDLPMQNTIGILGATPMWAVVIMFSLYFIIKNNFKINFNFYSALFLLYFLLTFFVSTFLLFWYFSLSGGGLNVVSYSTIPKLFFASSYYFFYFLFLYSLSEVVKSLSISNFSKGIDFVIFLLVVVSLVEYFSPGLFSSFHASMDGHGAGARIRLLFPESSMAAFSVNILIITSLIMSRSLVKSWGLIFLLFMMNIYIGSKASLVILSVSCGIVYYSDLSLGKKIKSIFYVVPFFFFVAYVVVRFVVPSFAHDVENFTSVSTRFITTIWAILSLFYYPFGEGYGTYIIFYIEPLAKSIDVALSIVDFPLNLAEVNSMISSGTNLAVKSGVLFSVVHSGFFALFFYFILFRKAFKDLAKMQKTLVRVIHFKVLIWYVFISITFAVNVEILYAFLMPFVLINFMRERYAYNQLSLYKTDY